MGRDVMMCGCCADGIGGHGTWLIVDTMTLAGIFTSSEMDILDIIYCRLSG
jgi:hypothetical protein